MSTFGPGDLTRRVSINDLGLTSLQGDETSTGPHAFLWAFFQLFKTALIHNVDNAAMRAPVHRLATLTDAFCGREGRVSLQARDGALFVNGTKLKLSTEEYALADDVFGFLAERGLAGFVVDAPLDEAAVRTLLAVMVYAPHADRSYDVLDARLRAEGLPVRLTRHVEAAGGTGGGDAVLERREYAFLTYSKAVVLYRSLISEERPDATRRAFLMRKITRVVQALVDICTDDDHTFLGIATVKSGDEYAPHHAVNTAVLAIALGDKIGLSKVDLGDLGLAALFHDFGMRSVPDAIRDKKEALDPAERATVARHLLESVEFLLGEKMLTRSALSRIVVAFEHHRRIAGDRRGDVRAADLFSRIVNICNVYDALTTDRPWRKAWLPDEALATMLYRMEGQFDPVLMKVFVNTLGLYPVGTMVRLDSGEIALVVYSGGDPERILRPIVALVDAEGRPGRPVDLLEKDSRGQFRRSIAFSEDPTRYGLNPSGLLAEAPTS